MTTTEPLFGRPLTGDIIGSNSIGKLRHRVAHFVVHGLRYLENIKKNSDLFFSHGRLI